MKYALGIWRALFAGLGTRDAGNGLVRMFEVEYANEARLMNKIHGYITPQMVEERLQLMKKER